MPEFLTLKEAADFQKKRKEEVIREEAGTMQETEKLNQVPGQSRPETLLNVKEASQEFGIGRDRLYQLAHTVANTGFPALWFGPRTVKFPREALMIWLGSERGRQALYQAMKAR